MTSVDWGSIHVPLRGAEQAHIAVQVVQQLTSSLVEGGLDAGTAQPIDGLLNCIQVTLTGCIRTEGGRGSVQTQNGLLHLVQQLYIYAYPVLHQGHMKCVRCGLTTLAWTG